MASGRTPGRVVPFLRARISRPPLPFGQVHVRRRLLDLSASPRPIRACVALDRVDFRMGRGEVVGLIGENGAGKSTLMKILGGVVSPSSGTIRLDGRDLASLISLGRPWPAASPSCIRN